MKRKTITGLATGAVVGTALSLAMMSSMDKKGKKKMGKKTKSFMNMANNKMGEIKNYME